MSSLEITTFLKLTDLHYVGHMRRVLINLTSVSRKKRYAGIETLLQNIHTLEFANKSNPSSAMMAERLELCDAAAATA